MKIYINFAVKPVVEEFLVEDFCSTQHHKGISSYHCYKQSSIRLLYPSLSVMIRFLRFVAHTARRVEDILAAAPVSRDPFMATTLTVLDLTKVLQG